MALQVGLQGYGSMPGALSGLSTQERATYCNDYWANSQPRLSTLEFTRDRKMMSTLVAGRRAPVLYVKVAGRHAYLHICCSVLSIADLVGRQLKLHPPPDACSTQGFWGKGLRQTRGPHSPPAAC